jgi:hypothetical protein
MFTTRTKSTELVLSIAVAGTLTVLTPAIAQQVTGTPGTPGATTKAARRVQVCGYWTSAIGTKQTCSMH